MSMPTLDTMLPRAVAAFFRYSVKLLGRAALGGGPLTVVRRRSRWLSGRASAPPKRGVCLPVWKVRAAVIVIEVEVEHGRVGHRSG